ncbi:hypothetical protein [Microcoleus sp. LEGE 07076]|uniref:hypothetical protein n=1 Tax=Microcoleus sp. LEGE 07076 TaxID=915322 RepID=UPI001D1385DC|nr:hypothetical protein [Microcoleus sp. LEGE 07076]
MIKISAVGPLRLKAGCKPRGRAADGSGDFDEGFELVFYYSGQAAVTGDRYSSLEYMV